MPPPLRFVLLEHDWQGVHFDLMLEADGALRAWRLAVPLRPGPQNAEASFDHRLHYLDHEGPISGDRGSVRRLDRGAYQGQLTAAGAVVQLEGESLRGRLTLTPTVSPHWTATWEPA